MSSCRNNVGIRVYKNFTILTMDGNPPISESPFMNMPEDNEDDRVLLGNSARQNHEHFFTNSQEEIDAVGEVQARYSN